MMSGSPFLARTLIAAAWRPAGQFLFRKQVAVRIDLYPADVVAVADPADRAPVPPGQRAAVPDRGKLVLKLYQQVHVVGLQLRGRFQGQLRVLIGPVQPEIPCNS
jgi:hypothetical protein